LTSFTEAQVHICVGSPREHEERQKSYPIMWRRPVFDLRLRRTCSPCP